MYVLTKDIALTQDIMRHGSPETTRRYIASPLKERSREALDQLPAELRRGPRRVS